MERPMQKLNDLSRSPSPLDPDGTLIAVIELSLSSWLVAGIVPGVERQPLKKLAVDESALLKLLHRWREEAAKAGHRIKRIAVAFEAGRDGFWLARWLSARDIEAHVIHASSVAVSRESDYSHIINARTVDRLALLIDPAKVIAGGKSDRDAHYLDPTLLYPVTWDDKIMEDEVFGPILPILTYKSFDEAMARMAKTGRPLAGFIFSRDQKTIDLFVETMPFGGTGSAGLGHYYGKYGFDALTHAKSMLISPPDVAIEHLYSPFTEEKNRQLAGWFDYLGNHGPCALEICCWHK